MTRRPAAHTEESSKARDFLRTAPHISVFPGLTILIVVLGLNLLGDGLRDVLDPQTGQA